MPPFAPTVTAQWACRLPKRANIPLFIPLASDFRGRTQSHRSFRWLQCRSTGAGRLINGHKETNYSTLSDDVDMQGEVLRVSGSRLLICAVHEVFFVANLLMLLFGHVSEFSVLGLLPQLCCQRPLPRELINILCKRILTELMNVRPSAHYWTQGLTCDSHGLARHTCGCMPRSRYQYSGQRVIVCSCSTRCGQTLQAGP